MLNAQCVRQSPPASQVRVVSYLVPWLFLLFWAQCAHPQSNPFYHPFYPDVTHVRKDTRPSPALPYCKRRKAGRGLGTRLVPPSLFTYVTAVVWSILSSMVMLFLSLTKHFTAWKAANASRQLICHCLSSEDQELPVHAPSQDAPQPRIEASDSITNEGLSVMMVLPFQADRGIQPPFNLFILLCGED